MNTDLIFFLTILTLTVLVLAIFSIIIIIDWYKTLIEHYKKPTKNNGNNNYQILEDLEEVSL